jgi:hypothetical protein
VGPTAGLEGGDALSYRDSIPGPSNPQQVAIHTKLSLHTLNVRTPVDMVTTGTLATLVISVTILTVRTSISTHLTINDYLSYQNSLHVMSAILAYFDTNWNSWTNFRKKPQYRIL